MIINHQYLKKYSPIPLNYEMSEIDNYVDIAEITYVRPILGEELYDEIVEQVEENTLTPENGSLLVQAIWPLLGFAVVYEALPFIWSHVSAVGLTKGFSDNSESLTLKDLTLVQTHLRNQVEQRMKFAVEWLNARADSFPLYIPKGCGCDKCGNVKHKNIFKDFYTPYRRCTDIR